jgi:hypothetical protein
VQKLGVYKSLQGYRWRPLNSTELLGIPSLQWCLVAIDKPGAINVRRQTR